MTIAEVIRENNGFWFRYQLDQSNFREVVYMIAAVNRDPKKAFPAKSKLWPIPDIDSVADEVGKQNEGVGRALLDHYKKIGKI